MAILGIPTRLFAKLIFLRIHEQKRVWLISFLLLSRTLFYGNQNIILPKPNSEEFLVFSFWGNAASIFADGQGMFSSFWIFWAPVESVTRIEIKIYGLWNIWVLTFFGYNCHFFKIYQSFLKYFCFKIKNLIPNMDQNPNTIERANQSITLLLGWANSLFRLPIGPMW